MPSLRYLCFFFGLAAVATNATAQSAITTVTDPATAISGTGATLNGTVNGNGEDIAAVYFDFGLTTTYSSVFATANPASVTAAQGATLVSLAIGALSCNTTYHFRVTADDMNGRNQPGSDLSFATAACPIPASAQAVPTLASWALILLAGSVAWGAAVRLR